MILHYLNHKFVRFLFVSALNTAFGYCLFALLIFLGLPYQVALLIGNIIGVLFNFKTTGHLVFKNKKKSLIYKFFGVYGVVYLFNVGCIALLKSNGINEYYAGAIVTVPAGFLAYWLNSRFVFGKD